MQLQHIKKALVTGGGGFLGGAIVKGLIACGVEVTSFSRNTYAGLASLGVEQIQGALEDMSAVASACRGMGVVFHTAAKTGVWGAYVDYFKTNVTGTENIIAACFKEKIPYLVYTSSPSVVFDGTDMAAADESAPYPDHFATHYPKTKAMAEQAVVKASKKRLKTISLRPHLIWGPEDTSLVPRIIARAKRLVKVGSGDNLVDTVYIDNAAEAHILAAEKLHLNPDLSGNIYFISQDAPIPLWEMVDRILAAADLPPVARMVSKNTAWAMGAILEGVYKVLGIRKEPLMTRFLAEELSTAHWFDITAAKKDLGYVPRVSTEEGLKRLREWLQADPSNR
jgi:2-alkyl-3-oxoalkanoate reductase